MDRCAVFVDAGYVLAAGGAICCDTKARSELAVDYRSLAAALAEYASSRSGLSVLWIYWYDGARNAVPTVEHLQIAELPNVKLRLGRLSGGEQKGVDSLIVRDLMTLGRERAMVTAFLLAETRISGRGWLPPRTWASVPFSWASPPQLETRPRR